MGLRSVVDVPEARSSQRLGDWPWCTFGFVALALWVSFGPWAAELRPLLRLEPGSFGAGELWRAVTAPLVHGWPELAAFDLGAIVLLGCVLERRCRLDVAISLPLAGLLSAGAVLVLRPDLTSYSGSSALASALFVLFALRLWQRSSGVESAGRWLAALAIGLFAGKIALEAVGFWPSPAGLATRGVESVPAAHVAGALAGVLVSLTGVSVRGVNRVPQACLGAQSVGVDRQVAPP